jgi:hypothetical protein
MLAIDGRHPSDGPAAARAVAGIVVIGLGALCTIGLVGLLSSTSDLPRLLFGVLAALTGVFVITRPLLTRPQPAVRVVRVARVGRDQR